MPTRSVSSKASHYRKLADEFTARAIAELGDRLKAVALYGPLVNGKPPVDNDIPLLIVVDDDNYATHSLLSGIDVDIAEANGWEPWFRLTVRTPAGLAASFNGMYPPVIEALQSGVFLYDAAGIAGDAHNALATG